MVVRAIPFRASNTRERVKNLGNFLFFNGSFSLLTGPAILPTAQPTFRQPSRPSNGPTVLPMLILLMAVIICKNYYTSFSYTSKCRIFTNVAVTLFDCINGDQSLQVSPMQSYFLYSMLPSAHRCHFVGTDLFGSPDVCLRITIQC